MPSKAPDSIQNKPNLKDMGALGIEFLEILEENFKKVQEWLDKALRKNPNYPWASYHMGVVYHELSEFEKSIEMYEKALELFSKDEKDEIADTYQNLGCSLWEVKRKKEANNKGSV